jgi:DNA-directed RNA polymerase subunit beta'
VRVTDSGDSRFLMGEQVERWRFDEENDRLSSPRTSSRHCGALLLGITKASLSTDSFISAASFQETTKVLTEAAIAGKVDELPGSRRT